MLVDRVVEIARNSTTVPGGACDDIHHCRTLLNIILSCVSTIFLCTWVALHPDVPDNPHEIGWKTGLLGDLRAKRIAIMPLAILVPEVILFLAFNQWIKSSEILTRTMHKYPECEWTEVHAQLLNMDGFQIVKQDGSRYRLYDSYEYNVKVPDSHKHLLTIPVEEINDKSKGDWIAKTFVVMQTVWFAAQVIARASQGLVVTKLELTVLGHVVVNIFIYWCWWHKPVDVKVPFDVYPIEKSVPFSFDNPRYYRKPRRGQPWRITLGTYIHGIVDYGLRPYMTWQPIVITVCGAIFGSAFGTVHLPAWNAQFPTHIESQLWRASAMVVTTAPGAGILLGYMTRLLLNLIFRRSQRSILRLNEIWITSQSIVMIHVYALARMCLLALALSTLRALPYDAYVTPSWTVIMPHMHI
ncbi:hypothetical protein F5887DRAFT_126696 [Amanita rubescens]|nr:hypothetical protein F5887DRAFT_126696 [Amanita rubescens]